MCFLYAWSILCEEILFRWYHFFGKNVNMHLIDGDGWSTDFPLREREYGLGGIYAEASWAQTRSMDVFDILLLPV